MYRYPYGTEGWDKWTEGAFPVPNVGDYVTGPPPQYEPLWVKHVVWYPFGDSEGQAPFAMVILRSGPAQ
jgi:hypothetical protein